MDLGWGCMYVFLLLEVAVASALIMPMPTNSVRLLLTSSINKLWSIAYVRYLCAMMLVLDSYLFYECMSFIYSPAAIHDKPRRFRDQQHVYLTSFSIGLFFVIYRLVQLHQQLHSARKIQKDLEKSKKKN